MMKVQLPPSPSLPISALAASLDNVTNSYKFYWFLAILESVRENAGRTFTLNSLLERMIANVWYPVNYYRLSFGKQDQLGRITTLLGKKSRLSIDSPHSRIIHIVHYHLEERDQVGRAILSLGNYVPYRFLRPFFAQSLRRTKDWEVNHHIRQMADQAFNSPHPCLYRFLYSPSPGIELHPAWFDYLQKHLVILTGFCLWHLVNYLQRNNPNVSGIAFKLFEPQARNLTLARKFWSLTLKQCGTLNCIYSGQPLTMKDFTIDHFLPWRFVTHDLLWNLIPTTKVVNSSKGDNLPSPAYIDPFAEMQYQAFQVVLQTPQAPRLLEDYILLFKASALSDLQGIDFVHFRDSLHTVIAPQLQIAANLGFSSDWKYTP